MKIKCSKCEFVMDFGDETLLELSLNVKCPNCKTRYSFKSELSITDSSDQDNIVICKRCGLKNEAQYTDCFDCGAPLTQQKGDSGQLAFRNKNELKKEKSKKRLSLIILWILGISIALAGYGALPDSIIVPFIYFIIALLIIPHTYSKIESRLDFRVSKKARVITILILFFLSSPFLPSREVKKKDTTSGLSEFMQSVEKNTPTTTKPTAITKNDCWDLGYKFGYCATLALHGVECRPEDDVVIPVECRGNNNLTDMGIKSGVEKAYDRLGLLKR